MRLALVLAALAVGCSGGDGDDDGFSVEDGDCDDLDPAVAPGVPETCDGIDQDCDGVVDDAPTDGETFYADDDGDGFGDASRPIVACARDEGWVADDTDCDDADDAVNPDATDTANRDRNCDGEVGGTAGTFDGPVLVTSATVACTAGDVVRFTVETQGLTSGGVVYAEETGNGSGGNPIWADEHTLESVASAPNGAWDHLERELETGAAFDDWQRDQSTLFRCDAHYESPGVMSYAVWVYDADGAFADCVAWGDDPAGMIDGRYERVYDPSIDLSACEIGLPAR